jgi:hypothetical protein
MSRSLPMATMPTENPWPPAKTKRGTEGESVCAMERVGDRGNPFVLGSLSPRMRLGRNPVPIYNTRGTGAAKLAELK